MKISLLMLFAASLCHAAEMTEETQHLLGIETSRLSETTLPQEYPTYATVLSGAPLIELFRQTATAHTALETSQESLTRVEKLFADGTLIARKEVQVAQTQVTQDRASERALEDRLILEWGTHFAELNSEQRASLLTELLVGKVSLLRLSLPYGEILVPLAARFQTLHCSSIFPAPSIDPTFQAQGFFALAETHLAVGTQLSGVAELAGEPSMGFVIPNAAVVFYLGKAWIYQPGESEGFERMGIPTAQPVEGGYFVHGEFSVIVSKGAQALLSRETLTPAEAE